MTTYSLAVCLLGLLVWLIFTKWQKVVDSWVAEVGKLSFFAGLLSYLFSVAGEKVF